LWRLDKVLGGDAHHLNLGGGPWFAGLGWKNLEGVASPLNPLPFRFSPDCVFPFADNSFDLVYSSHMLEHLDPPSIVRVLVEARRVVRPGGHFIVKVPDYELLLQKWRKGDASFFSDRFWDFSSVTWTWPVKSVPDTLANRASYIICGYWNAAYGEHFDRALQRAAGGYNGPVPMSEQALQDLLNTNDPSHIAATLRVAARDSEPNPTFNHQSAWTRKEFAGLLADAGFHVETAADDEAVVRRFSRIPKMRDMQDVSAYAVARK
jgi:SAM-dependent methyltransferase